MSEQGTKLPDEGREFVLADELKNVWMNNPLKSVGLEIMGKTILMCLVDLRPDIASRMIPYEHGVRYALDTKQLRALLPTDQLMLTDLWCTENPAVAALMDEIAETLDYNVVKDSVALELKICSGGTLFTLTFLRRAR